ncbi:unnamed protein product [Camellia sinensis]
MSLFKINKQSLKSLILILIFNPPTFLLSSLPATTTLLLPVIPAFVSGNLNFHLRGLLHQRQRFLLYPPTTHSTIATQPYLHHEPVSFPTRHRNLALPFAVRLQIAPSLRCNSLVAAHSRHHNLAHPPSYIAIFLFSYYFSSSFYIYISAPDLLLPTLSLSRFCFFFSLLLLLLLPDLQRSRPDLSLSLCLTRIRGKDKRH